MYGRGWLEWEVGRGDVVRMLEKGKRREYGRR